MDEKSSKNLNHKKLVLKSLHTYPQRLELLLHFNFFNYYFSSSPLPQSPQSKFPCNNICLNLLYTKTTKLKIPCICLFTKTNYSKQISNSSYIMIFSVKSISRKFSWKSFHGKTCFVLLFCFFIDRINPEDILTYVIKKTTTIWMCVILVLLLQKHNNLAKKGKRF